MNDRKKAKLAKRYCIAYGCLNNDGNNHDLTFFRLPKDIESWRKWLILLDREDLFTKEDFRPDCYVVCSEHFEVSSFKTIRMLKSGSVPMKVSPKPQGSQPAHVQIKHQNKTLYMASTQTEHLELAEKSTQVSKSWAAQNPTPEELNLKDKLRSSVNERQCLERKRKKLQKELEAKNSSIAEHSNDEIGKRFHKLIEWQNKLKSRFKGNRYDSEYKVFAHNLYYASPREYRSLRNILKLPSKATILRFKIDLPSKLDDRVIKSLEFKVKSLPDLAKYCMISIYDMTLKTLQNDLKTEVKGNEEISPEIVSNGYTVMVQGIHIKWKQPLAYTILEYTEHYKELDSWLKDVVSKLSGIGIKVKAITTVQGSNFDKYVKETKNVSVDKPYFMYDDKKIFYIIDVPDLIRCIRDELMTSDFYYEDKKISWDFIKQLYNYQIDKHSRLVPKLTESHMEPSNFKKVRVKYAVQVFSRTVSAALHTYIDLGIIPEEARPTANFLETMNDLFDVLNSSKIKCPNKYKSAFSKEPYQEKVLDDASTMLTKIKAYDKRTGNNNTAHTKSLENTQISIQSIRMLYEELRLEGIKYIFTRTLSQECLGNFFGTIHQNRSGQLTPIQFKRAFSKLLICNMLKSSSTANCETDIYDILLQAEEVKMALKC